MAADSDGSDDLTAVVTCEGDLCDPKFERRFDSLVTKLNAILGDVVKVHKLEPWNSVRVTLSIPREAALRLRKLASEGAAQLRALGILSVQVEGDQVISLRIANALNAEPQEILLQTTQDAGTSSRAENEAPLARFLAAVPAPATSTLSDADKVQFKSPNVVCPADSVVPKAASSPSTTAKPFAGPFPFASMNQAIHSSRETGYPVVPPPPPYPGSKHPTVTISSPLLVNLLQNDGAPQKKEPVSAVSAVKQLSNRTPVAVRNAVSSREVTLNKNNANAAAANGKSIGSHQPSVTSQAATSPSALTNTSIRQSSKPNSTITSNAVPTYTNSLSSSSVAVARNLPPPPPYSVAVNRQWDSVVHTSPFLDLTPSLTDLKADDLEHLLPTLERDLARSPPEIPEELTTRSDEKRNFLINPLTGELEPQSSGESDGDEVTGDVFTGLPSPAPISDEDTNSTIRPDTTTDQSDSETRSSHSDSGKHSRIKSKVRDRGRDSPGLKPAATEKIKLRLKLEKSEPINAAYKVDVSFIQQPKKAVTTATTPSTTPCEEPRVPPLHISLRGRHHAFITNKKKAKLNPDGTLKPKMRKAQQDLVGGKAKKSGEASAIGGNVEETASLSNEAADKGKTTTTTLVNVGGDPRKVKKFKSNHETATGAAFVQEAELISKLVIHGSGHYKEKQKERRGSDSELARANMKFVDSNGLLLSSVVEKKRRLSQSETGGELVERPTVLGSTNVGTIAGLPQKPRKEKNKIKDGFKSSKELIRSKNFNKNIGDKFTKQVALPTGEIDMEAKFKQRLMEGNEKGIPRPPHRTENVHQIVAENNQIEKSDKMLKAESEPPPLKDKSPEPDKCNTPDRKQPDLGDKQAGRSPNSGAQGEDSGIESMDALSEKSPNQASQSPHADIPEPSLNKSKTQVPDMPDMLDIEAQLAKMEGLNGVEDVNENQHATQPKQLGQCCELTSALQDSLKQGTVSLSSVNTSPLTVKEQLQPADVSLVPVKSKAKDDDLEPLPVRVTPPLYTYSNPDKGRGSDSPTLSDDDSNSCSASSNQQQQPPPQQQQQQQQHKTNNQTKSLLEQLLIEIPTDNQTPSSPSPATRSVRTRALSKLNSPPDLNSPVCGSASVAVATSKQTRSATPATTKRKRHESDSSSGNNGLEEGRNSAKKTRKCSENAAELIKACMGVDAAKAALNSVKKTAQAQTATGKLQDESSDSDEPLIEKVRKTAAGGANSVTKSKVKSGSGVAMAAMAAMAAVGGGGGKGAAVNTRRSVRAAVPAPNTRSKGDRVVGLESEAAALRRKTRSAVSEGESKRKKEVK